MVCGCVWTKNIKILAARARVSTTFDTGDDDARRARTTGSETQVCAFLFQLITAVQFFFALSINSMSLMMDCISMEIDTVTYLGNLYAEVKRCVESTSASGALSHFSAMTRPSWLGRAARNRHRHAIEQASRRWNAP